MHFTGKIWGTNTISIKTDDISIKRVAALTFAKYRINAPASMTAMLIQRCPLIKYSLTVTF